MNRASGPGAGVRGTQGIPTAYSTLVMAVLVVVGLLGCAPSEVTPAPERPNVLLIVTDDQPATTVRHMPKLQELVGERG